MEMKLIASGIGASVPKMSIGFSLFSGVYIMMRRKRLAKPYILGIASGAEIGGKSGTLIVGHIETSWMKIDSAKHNWLCNRRILVGKTAEISLKGTLILSGGVDVSITIYDENSESKYSLSKVGIKSSGGQLTSTTIRGTIKDMMGKSQQRRLLCAQS